MTAKATHRIDPDEESPLLPPVPDGAPRTVLKITPLPKLQLSVLLLMQLCEPICSQCIDPFINQLITDFGFNGGDERQTGYYAGLISSLFYVAEALTVFHWSSLSDTLGRKPVLLTGLLGAGISMACFGLSRTLIGLIVSRCIAGFLNGNIGVMKSMMGEITNSTNRALGFALLSFTYSMGRTIGPFFGGFLARPQDRFPGYFAGAFWSNYPYFLPCLASALFVVISFLVGLIFLKETAPRQKCIGVTGAVESNPNVPVKGTQLEAPSPFRALLVFPILISIANYATLAFLDDAFFCLLPLFLSTPMEYGGLGFTPLQIGRYLSVLGVCIGIFPAVVMPPLVRRFGPKRVYIGGMVMFMPAYVLFPLSNALARSTGGVGPAVWAVMACQLVCNMMAEISYGCAFIYITTAAPSARSLGATNGLSQTTVSISRAASKITASWLFAFSAERNALGGYAVYAVFVVLTGLCLLAAAPLPESGWDETGDKTSVA